MENEIRPRIFAGKHLHAINSSSEFFDTLKPKHACFGKTATKYVELREH